MEGNRPLAGRTALVTGGSRGLGREMVLAFAEAGADVVIASRKVDNCEQLADEIKERTGQRALGLALHVGDWRSIGMAVEQVYSEVGSLDVLVNNAGIAPLYPSLPEVSEELFDKVVAVNLKGPFRLSALVADRMSSDRGGSIINISSIAALRPTPNDLPYAAAKAGLNAITAGFAQAYGPKVRVNAIMAGPFLTDISKAWDMVAFERDAERFPLRRAGRPHEIVGAALYLAGGSSSYTTGSVITVDGGRTAFSM